MVLTKLGATQEAAWLCCLTVKQIIHDNSVKPNKMKTPSHGSVSWFCLMVLSIDVENLRSWRTPAFDHAGRNPAISEMC